MKISWHRDGFVSVNKVNVAKWQRQPDGAFSVQPIGPVKNMPGVNAFPRYMANNKIMEWAVISGIVTATDMQEE